MLRVKCSVGDRPIAYLHRRSDAGPIQCVLSNTKPCTLQYAGIESEAIRIRSAIDVHCLHGEDMPNPLIDGRAATEEDVEAGISVFCVPDERRQPLNLAPPQPRVVEFVLHPQIC
jgi:hypothetical protein